MAKNGPRFDERSPRRSGKASISPSAEVTAGPASDDGAVHERLAASERALVDIRDELLRVLADQDNERKAAARHQEEAVRYAASQLARDLLDSLDNLRRAIESPPPGSEVDSLLNGVLATERNLMQALAKHGVRRMDPLGQPFDPTLHEAVYEREDPNFDHGAVIEVLQPGYVVHDRLLRPAKVGVANNKNIEPVND